MLLELEDKFWNYWILNNAFFISLKFVWSRLWDIDADLDFLDTDIPCKHCLLQGLLKTSLTHVFRASWRRLGRRKVVTLRHVEDVMKNCLKGILKEIFAENCQKQPLYMFCKKNVFFNISQISQKNICAGVSS